MSFSLSKEPIIAPDDSAASESAAETERELPRSYGKPLLVAIARDPHTLFAYWDIDWTSEFGEAPPPDRQVYLRVIRTDGTEEKTVPVEPLAGGHYIEAELADAAYHLELSYDDAAGERKSVATSRSVITPRDSISENSEFQLVTVPLHLEYQRLLEVLRQPRFDAAGLSAVLGQLQRRADEHPEEMSEDEQRVLEEIGWSASAGEVEQRKAARSESAPVVAALAARWQRILRSPANSSPGQGGS